MVILAFVFACQGDFGEAPRLVHWRFAPAAGIVWSTIRRRPGAMVDPDLAAAESELWLYVLTFLFVYSVPSSYVVGYNARVPGTGDTLLRQGKLTALALDLGMPLPARTVEYGELLDLRTRLPARDIRDLVVHARFDLLVHRLVILQKTNDSTTPAGR